MIAFIFFVCRGGPLGVFFFSHERAASRGPRFGVKELASCHGGGGGKNKNVDDFFSFGWNLDGMGDGAGGQKLTPPILTFFSRKNV